jgi:hypothetical protein
MIAKILGKGNSAMGSSEEHLGQMRRTFLKEILIIFVALMISMIFLTAQARSMALSWTPTPQPTQTIVSESTTGK